MTEFLLDNLLLLPFLFVTYLVLEMLEARAEGALERGLGRTRSGWGCRSSAGPTARSTTAPRTT